MIAIDNANPDTAEIFFAVALFLAAIAAILYAVGTRAVRTTDDARTVNVAVWAPVLLSLAVASIGLAWWVA